MEKVFFSKDILLYYMKNFNLLTDEMVVFNELFLTKVILGNNVILKRNIVIRVIVMLDSMIKNVVKVFNSKHDNTVDFDIKDIINNFLEIKNFLDVVKEVDEDINLKNIMTNPIVKIVVFEETFNFEVVKEKVDVDKKVEEDNINTIVL